MKNAYQKLQIIVMYTCQICGISLNPKVANALDNLAYQIKFVTKPTAHLEVIATFHGARNKRTLIHIPTEGLTNLTATADGAPAIILDDPKNPKHDTRYILHLQPKALLEVHYNLTQTFINPPTVSALWHAIINPTYFCFVGYQVVVWPEQFKQGIALSLTWSMPPFTKLFNSFSVLQKQQTITLSDIEELNSSLFLGGDFRLTNTQEQINGQVIYTVMRGEWPFTDIDYITNLNRTFAAINDFWPTGHPKVLLNAILPVSPLLQNEALSSNKKPYQQIGGIWLHNAFILMASIPKSSSTLWNSIDSIVAHEYNHNWVFSRLVRLKKNNDNFGSRWFIEGINEYMAQKILLRSHNITLEDYISHINQVVAGYFTSPEFGLNINRGEFPPLTKETIYKIQQPYYRGELLALLWSAGNILGYQPIDTTLLNLLNDASTNLPFFSDKLIANYLAQLGVVNAFNDIKRYARQGETIPLTGDELGPCVTFKEIPMLRYDIGFDLQRSKAESTILGLKQNGPAIKAGLKEGDRFTQLSYDYGNTKSQVQITLTSTKASNNQTITYDPTIPIQVIQYSLKQNLETCSKVN